MLTNQGKKKRGEKFSKRRINDHDDDDNDDHG
jgi:hypothetical protein